VTQPPPPAQVELAQGGTYWGTIYNDTVRQAAYFSLVFRADGGVVRGCIIVRRPLYGSGPIAGRLNGSVLTFTASGAMGRGDFRAAINGNAISGGYLAVLANGFRQQGRFTVQKQSEQMPPPNFNPYTCPNDLQVQ
jgi:hypothetical protein